MSEDKIMFGECGICDQGERKWMPCICDDEPAPTEEAAHTPPSEHLLKWAIDLGFATGHADTEQDLLDEVGAQIRELMEKVSEYEHGKR